MKNFFDTTIRTLFLALLVVSSFVACSDDDDDEGPSSKLNGKQEIALTFSQDLINVADITIEYNDATNKKITETITTTTWNKTITFESLPANTLYSVKVVLKASYPEKEEYNITFNRSVYASLMKDGESNAFKNYTINKSSLGVKKAGLSTAIKSFTETWEAVITKDGVNETE